MSRVDTAERMIGLITRIDDAVIFLRDNPTADPAILETKRLGAIAIARQFSAEAPAALRELNHMCIQLKSSMDIAGENRVREFMLIIRKKVELFERVMG